MTSTSKAQRLRTLTTVLLAHAGWRPNRHGSAWLLGIAASLALGIWVQSTGDPTLALAWFGVIWISYYVGNALILGTRFAARSIERRGEDAAFARYEVIVGLMFLNQGLAVGVVSGLELPGSTPPLPAEVAVPLGVLLCAVGLVVKVWATILVGVDTYYFKDMFVGRPVGPRVTSGPYRIFSHPMYGVGHLHAYGFALIAGSWPGLLAAAVCQVSILAFCAAVEVPFARRLQNAPAPVFSVQPQAEVP